LLQAYIGLRNAEAAQHVLDVLFALKDPALEQRLWGFSNAIAELMESRRTTAGAAAGPAQHINLVSISKPIWSYGIEELPGLLPANVGSHSMPVGCYGIAALAGLLPAKKGTLKRIAVARPAHRGLQDAEPLARNPEDDLGRLVRGLPLWLAETLYFSKQYASIAAV